MGFFRRRDNNNLPKEVEKTFEGIYKAQEPDRMIDKAISFRNLKQYDKAFEILVQVIKKCPDYPPGWTVMGITLMHQGEIDAAEELFLRVLKEHSNDPKFFLFEIYANLGSLRWNHRHDPDGAVKYYGLALETTKPEDLADMDFESMKSNIYRDLCVVCFNSNDYSTAKKWAIKRLNVVNDCRVASRILGTCIVQQDLVSDSIVNTILDDREPKMLTLAIQCFRTCLTDNQNDPLSLFAIGLSITFLQLWAGLHNRSLSFSLTEEGKSHVQHLFDLAENIEIAKQLSQNFQVIIERASKSIILESAKM